jgi:hypothetical protein
MNLKTMSIEDLTKEVNCLTAILQAIANLQSEELIDGIGSVWLATNKMYSTVNAELRRRMIL